MKHSPVAPASLGRLVKTCLAKDPQARWSSAHDVALQLRGIAEAPDAAAASSSARSRWGERAGWGVAAAAILGLIAFAIVGRGMRAEPRLDLVSILTPENTTLTPGESPQISADGRHVAFVANDTSGRSLLYLRGLDRPDATPLAGTDGATQPFWAPDSRRLGFFARGALKTLAISGGVPQTIARAAVPRGGSWSPDDVIVFVPDPSVQLRRVPAGGGEATPLQVDSDPAVVRWFPTFLPDGRHYLYLAVGRNRIGSGIHVGSIDSPENRLLVPSRASAVYAEPGRRPDLGLLSRFGEPGRSAAEAGYLIFRRETTIVAQRFDAERLEVTESPVPIAENAGFNALTYQGLFSASRTGALAYAGSSAASQLTWLDRAGKRLGTLGPPGDYNSLCLSPDGRRVVYDLADPASGAVDIWSVEIATGTTTRLTYDPAVDFYPVCPPGGDEVIFSSLRQGAPDLYRQSLGAPGGERLLLDTPLPKTASHWSRDGRFLLYQTNDPKTQRDIWVLPLSGGDGPRPVIATPADDRTACLSPDGRWIAYASNDSDRFEVYVQPFPPTGAKWQISRGGGSQPQWSQGTNAGRELFYLTPDQRIMAVEVSASGGAFAAGRQRVVVETRVTAWERNPLGAPFAFTPDGQRILVINAAEAVRPISLVLNWTGALTR